MDAVLFRKNKRYIRKTITPLRLHLFRFTGDPPDCQTDIIHFDNVDRIRSTVAFLNVIRTDVRAETFSLKQQLLNDIFCQYLIEKRVRKMQNVIDERIAKSVEYIKDNSGNALSLATAAEKSGLSYVQFSRLFKNNMHMTPFEYITMLKINKAEKLLTSTDMKIIDIASLCGFENEYYFSNFFKKHCHISPLGFRKGVASGNIHNTAGYTDDLY